MKGSKVYISNSFIIVLNIKTAFILTEVLFLVLKEVCINEFLVFVQNETNNDSKSIRVCSPAPGFVQSFQFV